jgi:hypothetical protein
MSVISNLPATPNRVEIIVRYLDSCGARGIARDQLMARVSPPALRRGNGFGESDEPVAGQTTVAGAVLDEILRLGLAERYDDGGSEWIRAVGLTSADRRADVPSEDFRSRLECVLFDPAAAEAADQRQFAKALAWFLAQDPERPFDFGQNARQRIEEQCGPEVNAFELTNASRAQNFFYWARYLGYAWYAGVVNSPPIIVPDPTSALERHLPRLMGGHRTLPFVDLMEAWSEPCPVLEGGVVRTAVEEILPAALRRPAGTLSRSTSLALQRLDRRGVIHLERQPDAPAIMLATWPDPLPISHITYTRMA